MNRESGEKGVTYERLPKMKPSALWKDFREEELFYPLSVNLPGNAAPLQHGKARVTDSELSNPATFPLCSPESLPRHMMA